eukprot:1432478-Alexandrium_andersonii.AAC.1
MLSVPRVADAPRFMSTQADSRFNELPLPNLQYRCWGLPSAARGAPLFMLVPRVFRTCHARTRAFSVARASSLVTCTTGQAC